jgi:hypothetical protein
MIEMRLRTRIPQSELEKKIGKIVTDADYNLLLTGPGKILKPNGQALCVYLPGVMSAHTKDNDAYQALHSLRSIKSDNRGTASGSDYARESHLNNAGKNTIRYMNVPSTIIGATDASGRQLYCRLTAWTGSNIPQWQTIHPMLRTVAKHFEKHVPDRYAAQMEQVRQTKPEWIVPGTPFSTVTVNNSWSTGVHVDDGDLPQGFSTLVCIRRGNYTGGRLTFPRYRVAVDMQDGDLILMDAHEYHGNTSIVCECGNVCNGMCKVCTAERISLVSYFKTRMTKCGTADEEYKKAAKRAEDRSRKDIEGKNAS